MKTKDPPGSNDTASQPFGLFAAGLVEARSWSFSSARALFQKREFGFSYGTYILFERGERLPSASQLSEIITAIEVAPQFLLLHWASAQFDDPDLKKIFEEMPQKGRPEPKSSHASKDLPLPSMDSTWVLNKKDIDEITKNPWVWDVIADIVTSFPKGISAHTLKERYGHGAEELRDTYLKRWIGNDDIVFVNGYFVSSGPFVHLPATPQAEEIRSYSTQAAASGLIRRGPDSEVPALLRRMLRVRLDGKQAAVLASKFEHLLGEVMDSAARGGNEKGLYELILLLGRRQ
jgi:hypothetical protein